MSSTVAMKTKKKEEDVKGGELLFCGTTRSEADIRRKKVLPGDIFVSPTRLRSLVGVDIRYVASGCASCHCVALSVDGRCFTWGKNEKGQLGHGDKISRNSPTVVSGLSKYKVVKAGSGGGHTVVQTVDGTSFSFGWNKHGQLGTGSTKKEVELSPVQCLITDVRDVACGTDFTVWLTSIKGASIQTAGHPQYGQLGHGTDNEYNTKESSVRLAYEAQPRPKAIASLSDETILKVACGSNHTVALDSKGYIYTWGFGGYGRLGHREQKDEWSPRRVDVFTKHNLVPPDAILSAGSVSSACTAGVGKIYIWGKIKITGDNYMYPQPLMDLSGWKIRCMDSGSLHNFVGAESSCISWGIAQSGQLGYGPNQQKSSANPKKVDILEGMNVISVACGFAHSLVVVDRSNVGDQLDKLDVYDDKDTDEGIKEPATSKKTTRNSAAKTSDNANKGKKRIKEPATSKKTTRNSAAKISDNANKRKKKTEESYESEVIEESHESENDSVEKTSGQNKQRRGKASSRGRSSAATKAATLARRGRSRTKTS
ncbi:regulator of chromosome condensation (RCC1) family protein [Artemisia annua]|uniref:Regulator of chromosome condensation (RCC1) family protein n=1 Tax=Artemisia annua TaxID=35608 RepID=A0A2U1KLJ3_ARTAN|nr:regulator of chromosome condensation (RCC1) family protein [Artemisia annua]